MDIAVKARQDPLLCCVDCKNLSFNMRVGFWRNKMCASDSSLMIALPIFRFDTMVWEHFQWLQITD